MIAYNYTQDARFDEINGVRVQWLGMLVQGSRQFMIYKTPHDDKNYIEEKISQRISDRFYGDDQLVYIADDKLWMLLMKIAQREGILP